MNLNSLFPFFYAATLIVVQTGCTKPAKDKGKIENKEHAILFKKIASCDSLIASTNDSTDLVQLYTDKLQWTATIHDLLNWCKTSIALYEIKSEGEENYAKGIEHLNAIIAKEPELAINDTLKPLLAKAFGYRYYIFEQLDINHKVIADCEKYLQYSNPELDKDYLSFILNASGIAYCKIGDHRESINKLEQLLAIADTEQDALASGRTYVNLSNSFFNIGNMESAMATAKNGLNIPGIATNHRAFLFAILANTAISVKNYTLAASSINSAIKLLENTSENESLADIYSIQGDLNEILNNNRALESYQKAFAYRRINNKDTKGRDIAKLFIKIGAIYAGQNNWDTAIDYHNKAIGSLSTRVIKKNRVVFPEDDALIPENSMMDALDACANVLVQSASENKDTLDLYTALECIEKAFKVEEMLRQHFIFDQSKYAGLLNSKNRSAIAIGVCYDLYRNTGNQAWAEKGFLFAEKSKANVLMDKVKENILWNGKDRNVQKARSALLLLDNIDEKIKILEKEPVKELQQLDALKKDKEQLEKDYAIFKSQINTVLFEKTKYENNATTISAIVDHLCKDNNLILEFFIADTVLFQFQINSKNGVAMEAIPYTAIEKKLEHLLRFYTDPNNYNNFPKQYDSLATELFLKLLPTVSKRNPSEILIIPDGALYRLPFESLKSGGRFIIEKYNILYGFSCLSLMEQEKIKVTSPPNAIVIYAPFEQFSNEKMTRLEQSKLEVEAIANFNKNATVFTNQNATLGSFLQNTGKNSVMHLATHAIASGDDAEQSSIAFADSNLTIRKVYGLSLYNNLVILSACETGIGILQQTEGNLSMARAFYYAGAKNVINSLWKVNDNSTGKIFNSFYGYLKQKASVSEALYKAKLNYLKAAGLEQLSPYYWSSFICIGTGKLQVRGSESNFWYLLLLLVPAVWVYWKYRKRKARNN